MLRRKMRRVQDPSSRPKSSLGSVRIEEFYGDRLRYMKWKRATEAQQHLYGLEPRELSMLVYKKHEMWLSSTPSAPTLTSEVSTHSADGRSL